MGFHSQDAAHKPKLTMSSLGWSGVKHTATRIWSIGNMFSEMMNDVSLSRSLMKESGLSRYQENTIYHNA